MRPFERIPSGVIIVLLIYVFLVGLEALGTGFKLLGKDAVETFFAATVNPFAGLAIGILTTSVVQSSSVTTSMVVALVANPSVPLPIENAIPMVMGANIGTTVTNTLVSFGHVANPVAFRRAIAFGTLDDFFNLCTLLWLFPLEMAFAPLRRLSSFLVSWIPRTSGADLPNPVKQAAGLVVEPVQGGLQRLLPDVLVGAALLVLAAVLIFVAVHFLVVRLHEVGQDRLRAWVHRALGTKAWRGFVVGAVGTAAVQSSSVVLSLLVPLAGAGALTLAQGFPLALGANVGTTITALLAASGAATHMLAVAIQIALVHLLFNIIGTLVLYPLSTLRAIPMSLSEWIGDVAVRSKVRALLYMVLIFYGLPAVGVLLMSRVAPHG